MLSLHASIGLKNLIPALGLMSNYKIVDSVQVVDEIKSGCLNCPHRISCNEHTDSFCKSCLHKVYKIEDSITYVNEKNTYGEKKTLKRNALLLLLYLHFLHPDGCGLVTIHIKDAAKAIGCEERTVRNNLNLLNNAEYICLQKGLYPGTYRVFIQSYEEYFLPANQGGRGYISMSKDAFLTFSDEKDLNTIRIGLRMLAGTASKRKLSFVNRECTFRQMKQLLPDYVCTKTLKNSLQSSCINKIFQVSKSIYTDFVQIKDEYNPEKLKERLLKHCREKIEKWQKENNDAATKRGYKHAKHWFLNNEELNSITAIGLQYDIKFILTALEKIYTDYISKNLKIENTGALVRSLTRTYSLNFSISE